MASGWQCCRIFGLYEAIVRYEADSKKHAMLHIGAFDRVHISLFQTNEAVRRYWLDRPGPVHISACYKVAACYKVVHTSVRLATK